MNMIFYIIGIVLWGYGIRLAVTSGIYLDSIFFVIVGGQAVRIGETIADGVELARWKEYIEKEKNGEATMEDLKLFLDKKYKMKESANALK